MRNSPLRAFVKKSPMTDNPSVSDSVSRGNIKTNIKIIEKKKETYNPGKDAPGPGKVYNPDKKRVSAAIQANPLATLFAGRNPKS